MDIFIIKMSLGFPYAPGEPARSVLVDIMAHEHTEDIDSLCVIKVVK